MVLGGGGNNYISCCLAVVLYTPGWREHCGFRSRGRYSVSCVSGCGAVYMPF